MISNAVVVISYNAFMFKVFIDTILIAPSQGNIQASNGIESSVKCHPHGVSSLDHEIYKLSATLTAYSCP
jgi:hypothetical protein